MRTILCTVGTALLLLLMGAGIDAHHQLSATNSLRGSVEGRISFAGKPAVGVTLTLVSRAGQTLEPKGVSLSDEDGRFIFRSVEPGDYLVDAFAPALVGVGATLYNLARGRAVAVHDGEAVRGIDIALTKGGVIAGHVSDVNRYPIIEITVDLVQIDPSGRVLPRLVRASDQFMYKTDDTGSFRIFGLPAGRYKVSVGVPAGAGAIRYEGGFYRRTYYPEATDESQAGVVEIVEGGEAHDVDIRVGSFEKSYSVSGRVVNADTGKSLVGRQCGYGLLSDSGQFVGTVAVLGTPSGPNGEFFIEGLPAGRYAAFFVNEGDTALYCEPTQFEVKDSDIDGLEIKARAGANLSGTIAFEDDSRIEGVEKLAIDIVATPFALEAFRRDMVRISPDGRFSAIGLRPGKAAFAVRGSIGGKSVSLSRMEVNGVPQELIDLQAGESVAGVRLVLRRTQEPH